MLNVTGVEKNINLVIKLVETYSDYVHYQM